MPFLPPPKPVRSATAKSSSTTSTTPSASAPAKPTPRRCDPAHVQACQQEFNHDVEEDTWRGIGGAPRGSPLRVVYFPIPSPAPSCGVRRRLRRTSPTPPL